MAIPLSNEQKEVRAPQTANIKALDVSPMLQRMGENSLQMSRQMQESVRGGFNLGEKISLQNDAFRRNEAERKYNERTAELNEQLAEMQGEERIKFQPKYEAEMKIASDKYEAEINKVGNFEIREGSKRSINAWNVRNASNYQYENYQNDTYLQEKSMAQAMITDNQKRVMAINPADTADSLLRYAQDHDMGFSHGEQMIRNFYGNRMGLPSEVVDQYVQDYKSKGYIAMANRLVQVTREHTGNAAYTPAIDFINKGIEAGFVAPKDGIEAKRAFEKERLALNVVHNPEWFIKDGKFNPVGRNKFAPDMTQYEYEYFLKQALGSYKPGQTGAGAVVSQAFMAEYDRWMKDWLAAHGHFDDDSINEYIKMKASTGKVLTKEEALKELTASVDPEKRSPMEYVNLGKTLEKMQSEWVLVDNQKGFAVGKSEDIQGDQLGASTQKMTLEEMQEAFASDPNRYTLFQPLADYEPLARDRATTENNFRVITSALGKDPLFRDPGKTLDRKDEEGYYRTNNQERGLAMLSYISDTIPMTSSQMYDIMGRFNQLLPQNTLTGEVKPGENGEQVSYLSPLDPYGFVSDDDADSREKISLVLMHAMNGVLTNAQIQKAKQALDSRPFTEYIWTPNRDMENAAYVAPSRISAWGPMMGANTASYARNRVIATALGNRMEGYQTEHKKLYNKTYQAQNATREWAMKEVEKNKANGGMSVEQIRAAAADLDVAKKQANRRRR
jgi:hypothetical protein